MGRFFNEKMKNMRRIPRVGMEGMRQDFRKAQITATEAVGTITISSDSPTVSASSTSNPNGITTTVYLTPNQIKMAKVRAARGMKRAA